MESVEPRIGERVLVDLPRTRWDHRQGILREIRTEPGQPSQGFVYLSWMLVRFPMKCLVKCEPSELTARSASEEDGLAAKDQTVL
jgi:hypothetical protein